MSQNQMIYKLGEGGPVFKAMGGEGGAFGAFVGAALLEVIRNSLLMAGVDSNWQGAFVGIFIVLAVLLEKFRGRRRS
jgi:ribose transport system permease protein